MVATKGTKRKYNPTKTEMELDKKSAKKKKYTSNVSDGKSRTVGNYGRYGIPYNKTMSGPEKKYVQTKYVRVQNAAGVNCSSGGTSSLLAIAQGTAQNQRIGRQIVVKSIHVRVLVERSGAVPFDLLRCILYLDQQCNGVAAAITDILDPGVDGTNPDPTSYLNLSNSKRFKILRDETYANNTSSYDPVNNLHTQSHHYFDFHVTLDIPIEYSSTTGGITELKSNNVGVFIVGADKTNRAWSTLNARVRYSDS